MTSAHCRSGGVRMRSAAPTPYRRLVGLLIHEHDAVPPVCAEHPIARSRGESSHLVTMLHGPHESPREICGIATSKVQSPVSEYTSVFGNVTTYEGRPTGRRFE